jgi:flagellar hook-length control protein FliK
MQTGLQSFDLSILGASAKGLKTASGAAKPTSEAASDQLAGFMEIMSALMALPPEQLKHSLAGLDAMCADQESAFLPGMAGNTGQNMPPAALVKVIMSMKGTVLQQLHAAEADGRPHPFLDMAEALIKAPQAAALDSQGAAGAQLTDGADPEALLSQAENVVQDGPTNDPEALFPQAGNAVQNRLGSSKDGKGSPFPGVDPSAEKGGNPLGIEAAIDSETQNPDGRKEESRAGDFLFKTSDSQTESAPNAGPGKGAQTPVVEAFKTPVEANLSDETGPALDNEHPSLTNENAKNANLNPQLSAAGGNLEERLVQKTDSPVGGQPGILGRAEASQEPKGPTVPGELEVMSREKTTSSDVIRQIVQRMSMQTNGSQSKMVIRLKPEFLGNVHLHVLTENHQVTVRMMADSTLVKDIVEQNLPHLRAELQHHGLEIQKFDVFVANDDQGWRGGQEQAGFRDAMNRKQSRPGGGKSRQQRGKIALETGTEKKIVQKDPGEIDYFA